MALESEPTPAPLTNTRKALYVRLTPARAVALDAYEKRTGRSAADVARQILDQLLSPDAPVPVPRTVKDYTARTARRTLRLTPAEDELATALAERHGISTQRFVVGILRTALLKAAQPTEREITALDASTRQLQAIGVNLNQVVRRLNEAPPGQIPPGLADAIARVKDYIGTHTRAVDQLIKASLERWT